MINTKVFSLINSATDLLKELKKLIPTHVEYPILYTTEDLETINIESWDSLVGNKTD